MRYYVAQSSGFSYSKSVTPRIAKVVKAAGGRNVRSSLQFGWSNQPSVVTFDANPGQVKAIEKAVGKAERNQWVLVRKKNW